MYICSPVNSYCCRWNTSTTTLEELSQYNSMMSSFLYMRLWWQHSPFSSVSYLKWVLQVSMTYDYINKYNKRLSLQYFSSRYVNYHKLYHQIVAVLSLKPALICSGDQFFFFQDGLYYRNRAIERKLEFLVIGCVYYNSTPFVNRLAKKNLDIFSLLTMLPLSNREVVKECHTQRWAYWLCWSFTLSLLCSLLLVR